MRNFVLLILLVLLCSCVSEEQKQERIEKEIREKLMNTEGFDLQEDLSLETGTAKTVFAAVKNNGNEIVTYNLRVQCFAPGNAPTHRLIIMEPLTVMRGEVGIARGTLNAELMSENTYECNVIAESGDESYPIKVSIEVEPKI